MEINTPPDAANLVDETTPAIDATQQTQTTEPVVAAPPELYEVKVNGQTHKVPITELTGSYSRQQDYTKKTTEIAEYRRQIDAEVAQYREQISEVQKFFADARVQQALAGLRAGVTDPNQPLTTAQAQQLMTNQAQSQQQALEARLQAITQDIEVRTLAGQYKQEIDSTLSALTTKHPVLADIEGIETILRQKVAAQEPQSLDDAKRMFGEVAAQVAQRLESRFQTQQKQAAVQRTQLAKGGIEPPGGTVVPMQGEKQFKLGSKDLLNAAVADLVGASTK